MANICWNYSCDIQRDDPKIHFPSSQSNTKAGHMVPKLEITFPRYPCSGVGPCHRRQANPESGSDARHFQNSAWEQLAYAFLRSGPCPWGETGLTLGAALTTRIKWNGSWESGEMGWKELGSFSALVEQSCPTRIDLPGVLRGEE